MKHFIYAPICLSLLASLTACTGKDQPQSSPVEPEVSPTEAAPTEVASTEPLPKWGTTGTVPKTAGIGVYDKQFDDVRKSNLCAVDKINGQHAARQTIAVPAGSEISFEGWIVNPRQLPPPEFAVVLQSETATFALRGEPNLVRGDVAKALKAPAPIKAGFNVSSTLNGVPAGEYSLSLVQDSDDLVSKCDVSAKVLVE